MEVSVYLLGLNEDHCSSVASGSSTGSRVPNGPDLVAGFCGLPNGSSPGFHAGEGPAEPAEGGVGPRGMVVPGAGSEGTPAPPLRPAFGAPSANGVDRKSTRLNSS